MAKTKIKAVFSEKFYPPDFEQVCDNRVLEFSIVKNGDYRWQVTERMRWMVLGSVETRVHGKGNAPTLRDAKESGKIIYLRAIAKAY